MPELFTPAISTSITLLPKRTTIHLIGLANLNPFSFHTMYLGKGIFDTISSRVSFIISSVFIPFSSTFAKTNLPLGVSFTNKSSSLTPLDLAKPFPCSVNFPSLNATLSGGPFISNTLSSCLSCSASTNNASLLGVAYVSTSP